MVERIVAASRTVGTSLPQLAVLPFAVPAGVDQGDAEVLAQLLAVEIANGGKYAVLPRTATIQTVMAEHRIQRSGLTDADNIKVIGEALNARYVLAGSVRSLGRTNLFTAEIINIEDGSQLTGDAVNYRAMDDGLKLMAELGTKLTGGTPAGNIPANMVLVEGGTFQMGSTNGFDNEKPVHTVTVKSFYMGKYEVTQKEWTEVMGSNPSSFKGDTLPVESINWYEAVEYCNRLSLKEGLTPAYWGSGAAIVCDFHASGYRLPTEAEWEYAAKGGNKNFLSYEYSGGNSVDRVAWYSGNSGYSTHPVGTKQANDLGLYDMSGNVYEWCWDWYGRSYNSGSQNNPVGASSGSGRVLRGGSWGDDAGGVRSAYRGGNTPSGRYGNLGFRLVRPQF
jgi:formylglycine-generating enzyme required for sulfatase activity